MTGSAVAVGFTGAVAVLALAGPPRRSTRQALPPRDAGPAVLSGGADLAAGLYTVAAQLRAGADPPAAWREVLGVRPGDLVELERLLLERCRGDDGGRALWSPRRESVVPVGAVRSRRWVRSGAGAGAGARTGARSQAGRVRAAVAAVALAGELGAPLAPVLERIARSVALDEEAAADLEAALAGPRTTARLLAWLPALGVVLGLAIGADPVGVLLGGGIGSVAGAVGLALTLAGRVWTSRLVRTAAGTGP